VVKNGHAACVMAIPPDRFAQKVRLSLRIQLGPARAEFHPWNFGNGTESKSPLAVRKLGIARKLEIVTNGRCAIAELEYLSLLTF
jgi:hypothetical protein